MVGIREMKKSEIKEHYLSCKDVIQAHSKLEDTWRCGIGDHWNWYKKDNKNKKEYLWDLTNDSDYINLISEHRTLYWSLNFFKQELRTKCRTNQEPLGTLWDTIYYSLGIDIDTCEGREIEDYQVKAAVENCAKFFAHIMQSAGIRSYDTTFSGGGVYIIFHPRLLSYLEDDNENREYEWLFVLKRFNLWIQKKTEEFYRQTEKIEPEIRNLVKVDSLNNAKRQWKTILSIHKSKPYAVVPIDKKDPKINFSEAKVPLSEQVIEKSKKWLAEFDSKDIERLPGLVKKDVPKDEVIVPVEDMIGVPLEIKEIKQEDFPPCIRNILAYKHFSKGATRATTFLAVYLGQAGISKEEALKLFEEKCSLFGVAPTNRFDCWFQKMHTPSCAKIKEASGGFPQVGMGDANPPVCTPDEYCTGIKNPLDYRKKWTIPALKSPSLFMDIYSSLGKVIAGNAVLRRNIVYDLAIIGAPKIFLGNPVSPVRSLRTHPAVWVQGEAESGKGVLFKLIEEIAPKSFRVTRITPAALDRGFGEEIDNGVLLVPEGEALYTENYKNDVLVQSKESDPVVIQLRQLIEDNVLQLWTVRREDNAWVPTNERIETHPTVFIASTKAPQLPQMKTRFSIYHMEKTPSLSYEAMKKVIDGFFWKEQPGKYHPHELKELYATIYGKVRTIKAFKSEEKYYNDFLKLATRLALLFIRSDAKVKIGEKEVTSEELYRTVADFNFDTILEILDSLDADQRTNRLLNRAFENILRRVCASACLNTFKREIKDGILMLTQEDLEAGLEMVKDIEREYRPSISLRELVIEHLVKEVKAGNFTFKVNDVAYAIYSNQNKALTKSRKEQIRHALNSISLNNRVRKLRSGKEIIYVIEEKEAFLKEFADVNTHVNTMSTPLPPVDIDIEKRIFDIVAKISKKDNRGALIDVLVHCLSEYGENNVRKVIDKLIEDGDLFVKRDEQGDIYVMR